MFEQRLEELVERGEKKQAEELAIAVLRNEEVERLVITEDEIRIRTDRFSGTHDVIETTEGRAIHMYGDYRVDVEGIEFGFSVKSIHPDVEESAREGLRSLLNDPSLNRVVYDADGQCTPMASNTTSSQPITSD